MRHPMLPVLLAAAFGLAGCATPADPPMSEPSPPATVGCDADAARTNAIGKVATADVVEQARTDAGASMARVLKPGQMVTMEFAEGRLNIDVDAGNVITNLRCG